MDDQRFMDIARMTGIICGIGFFVFGFYVGIVDERNLFLALGNAFGGLIFGGLFCYFFVGYPLAKLIEWLTTK